jgi:hypothetical protein
MYGTVRRTARENGLAQALTELCGEAMPGVLPCGPGGHAVVPTVVAATADRIWQDGRVYDRATGEEEVLRRSGSLVALRHHPGGHADVIDHGGWARGLVWLRLGLSEGLLDACVRYLDSRACGESTVLRQQMVKGAVADVLIEQLEVHAALTGMDAPGLAHLHQQITVADRALLRLLGAAGFLADGAGETAYRSEVLAEAYTPTEVAP